MKNDIIISVIIPTLNEETTLELCLESLRAAGSEECIVVDGGSNDATRSVATRYTTEVLTVPGGRGVQCNAGAARARGRILCFLHADTRLPPDWGVQIRDVIDSRRCVGGAFRLGLEGGRWAWKLIEAGVNWRSRWLGLPYGDQAIFVRHDVFATLGGFRPLPFMEDVDFVRRLKRCGSLGLAKSRVTSSPRRWEQHGILTTTLSNNLVLLGYFLGMNLSTLHRWYTRPRAGVSTPPQRSRGTASSPCGSETSKVSVCPPSREAEVSLARGALRPADSTDVTSAP